MPIEAVIFDMDGILVASEDYWFESRVEWAGSLGKPWTLDDQRFTMGRNTSEWTAFMQERLGLHDMTLEQIANEVTGRVIQRVEAKLPLLPGAVEAVHTAATKYPVALASGSPIPIIERVMALTGLDKVFKAIVYADKMERGKPFPDVYLETARLLGIAPERCVGIEDSVNGIRSLEAAGMRIIAVPSPGFPLPDDVRAVVDLELASLEDFNVEMIEALERRVG